MARLASLVASLCAASLAACMSAALAQDRAEEAGLPPRAPLAFEGLGDKGLPSGARLAFHGLGETGLPTAPQPLAFVGIAADQPQGLEGALSFRGIAAAPPALIGALGFRGVAALPPAMRGALSFRGDVDRFVDALVKENAPPVCGNSRWLPNPKSATEYNGVAYARFEAPISWHEANAACEKLGGALASVETLEECSALFEVLHGCGGAGCWVGFSGTFKDGLKWLSGAEVSDEIPWSGAKGLLGSIGRGAEPGYGRHVNHGQFDMAPADGVFSETWRVGGYVCERPLSWEKLGGTWETALGAFEVVAVDGQALPDLEWSVEKEVRRAPTRWDGGRLAADIALDHLLESSACAEKRAGTSEWMTVLLDPSGVSELPGGGMRTTEMVMRPCGKVEAVTEPFVRMYSEE